MANTKKYENIIRQLLEEYASVKSPFWPDVENQVLIDTDRHHYQLVRLGWDDRRNFVHYVVFHFDIKDGKIWIQANNTDRNIADELATLGARPEDIILGFQLPEPTGAPSPEPVRQTR